MVIHGQQGFFKGIIVKGQRALDERAAGERDQADAAMALATHKIKNGKFRPLQPVRQDVGGQHAARTIQHEHHVLAQPRVVRRHAAPLRPREGKAGEPKRREQEGVFEPPPDRAVRRREFLDKMRRGQPRQLFAARGGGVPVQQRQQDRRDRRQPEPARFGKMETGERHL